MIKYRQSLFILVMSKSYAATVTENRVKWHGEVPPEVLNGKPVKVLVTILEQSLTNNRRWPFDLAAGEFVVPDGFDSPLPKEIVKDFED